jgi:hypothetical protein
MTLGINVIDTNDRAIARVHMTTLDDKPFAIVELIRVNGSGLTPAEAEVGFKSYEIDALTFAGVSPQNPEQDRLNAARAELRKRIESNNGKNPCAEVFGGRKKALNALDQTNFKFDPNLADLAKTVGSTTIINSSPDQAFMRPIGSTYSFDLVTASPLREEGGHQVRDTSWYSLRLKDVTAAAFLLAHELGHRRSIYGDNEDDGAHSDNAINNMKIWKACFSQTKPIKQ